ncbi:hypothetical protein B2A_12569, partial [mine drainage metagenome]
MSYGVLHPSARLIRTNKGALIRSRTNNNHLHITPTEAMILALCDGTRTREEIVDYIATAYGVDRARVTE